MMAQFESFTDQNLGLQQQRHLYRRILAVCWDSVRSVLSCVWTHTFSCQTVFIHKTLQFLNSADEDTVGEQGKGLHIHELCTFLTTSWCSPWSIYASILGFHQQTIQLNGVVFWFVVCFVFFFFNLDLRTFGSDIFLGLFVAVIFLYKRTQSTL